MNFPDRLRTPWAWDYRHPRVAIPVRIASGIWLVVLTVILYSHGIGGWWGLLLVPAAALHFYLAYRTLRHHDESQRRLANRR
jgi:4-hydroxybenzoate polyprenyltransferase